MCIVVTGNAFDGLQCYGPFDNNLLAIEWAARCLRAAWQVVQLKEAAYDCP